MQIINTVIYIALGFGIGVTAGLSFLRTEWSVYQVDFLLWWSITTTVLGVIFLMGNVGQYVALVKEKDLIQKEKEIHKSQVKVWQHHTNGIEGGLFMIIYKTFSSVEDMKTAVEAVQRVASSLSTSLNEERLFTDEEIKAKQIQKEEEHKSLMKRAESKEV